MKGNSHSSHEGEASEPLFLNGGDADREKWGGRPDSMGEMGGQNARGKELRRLCETSESEEQ